jgi:thiol-disulfide isomerase/thioredoxin
MAGSEVSIKSFFKNLPSIAQNVMIVLFATLLIGCAYYIYKKYVLNQSDRSLYEGYANGMNMRRENPNKDNVVTLYFFGTSWCPHCISAKPEWNSFVEENKNKEFNGKRVIFVDVDCDKEQAIADKYDVSGYPTIKLDKGDNNIIEFKSKPTKATLTEFLNSV